MGLGQAVGLCSGWRTRPGTAWALGALSPTWPSGGVAACGKGPDTLRDQQVPEQGVLGEQDHSVLSFHLNAGASCHILRSCLGLSPCRLQDLDSQLSFLLYLPRNWILNLWSLLVNSWLADTQLDLPWTLMFCVCLLPSLHLFIHHSNIHSVTMDWVPIMARYSAGAGDITVTKMDMPLPLGG